MPMPAGRTCWLLRRLSDLARAFVDGTEALTGPAASKTRQRLPGDGQARQQPPPG